MEQKPKKPRIYPVIAILVLLLFACNPSQAEIPSPTPQPITVVMPPDLLPLREALHTCAVAQPQIALIMNEVPAQSALESDADLVLRLGMPQEAKSYALPLARETISIILHPSNSVRSLNQESLQALFTGQTKNWAEIGGEDLEVQVWAYPPGNEIRTAYDTTILDENPLTPTALLAPDPEVMLDSIAGETGAIGYIPTGWLSSQVRALALSKALEAELSLPVLGLAPSEPQGVLREYLLCLQNGEGQAVILRNYLPFYQDK